MFSQSMQAAVFQQGTERLQEQLRVEQQRRQEEHQRYVEEQRREREERDRERERERQREIALNEERRQRDLLNAMNAAQWQSMSAFHHGQNGFPPPPPPGQ